MFLKKTTLIWFIITLIGQWIFAFYTAIYHGSLIFQKGLIGMSSTHMPNGYINGDNFGNILLATHLFIAVFIIAAGPLQLVPKIRMHYPKFHRLTGRSYIIFVFIAALGGLYLTWTRPRPSFGSIFQDLAISLDAVLIIVFSFFTLRYALKRKFNVHRKWALRLFLVASGVWFLRIGYKAWYFLENLIGFKFENFFNYWCFAAYLIPLAVLEVYFLTEKKKTKKLQIITSVILLIATTYMALGIYLATKDMWLPRIYSTI